MNKKGFTLIELLAVIVILAIIALIATPIVLNIISDSKESSELRSADFYLDALELSIAQSTLDGKAIDDNTYNIMPNGNICLETYDSTTKLCTDGADSDTEINELVVEVKGKVPTGTVTIANGQIENVSVVIENKEIVKNFKGELIYNLKLEEMCELQEGYTAKTVGSKYSCDLGDGERYFYVLEVKIDEVALILNGNYDETTQTWCDQNGETPNDGKCNADGLTGKLDEIASSWIKLKRQQIVLPTVEQIALAAGLENYLNNPTLSPSNSWLYLWEGNTNYNENKSSSYGYWTSSLLPGTSTLAWNVGQIGVISYDYINDSSMGDCNYSVRPVINLKI